MSKANVTLYFDTSALEPIARQGAGGRVKALLKAHDAVATASVQNLVEIWRMPDTVTTVTRPQLLRALLQVARDHEVEPNAYRAVLAVVRQLQSRHPDWVEPTPDLRAIHRRSARQREIWTQLRNDASYRPKGVVAYDPFLRGLIANSERVQKLRRRADRAGLVLPSPVTEPTIAARLQPLVDALPAPDAYWRQQTGAAWWLAMTRADAGVRDLFDWGRPHLALHRIDVEGWMRFWLDELDPATIPITRVIGLMDYFQTERKIDRGNWGDINHSGFAIGRDYLITADRNFYEALRKTGSQPGVQIATPLLIDRDAADIWLEIKSGLRW